MEVSPDDVVVSGLFSYPIKSCAGIAHLSAPLDITGLRHDREWMLVNTRHSPARFITQREQPLLATVGVAVDDAGNLALSRSGADSITVAKPSANANFMRVKVWGSEVFGNDAGDLPALWFAALLGVNASHIRLVCFHRAHPRECNSKYAGNAGAHTYFADGYPVLVTNQASLDDLNKRMGRDVVTSAPGAANALPMNRFRPNIVLSGLPAWDEDHIDTIAIGDCVLQLVKPCVRCEITTTDQTSGTRLSDEPLNTLAKFRNNPDFGGVTFGWNAIVVCAGPLSLQTRGKVNYRF
jgi:uncharacterized protein